MRVPFVLGLCLLAHCTRASQTGRRHDHIGCYKDWAHPRRILPHQKRLETNSAEKCRDYCLNKHENHRYAGLQYTTQCFCGETFRTSIKSKNCTMPCPIARDHKCGGPYAMNVYEIYHHDPCEGVTCHHGGRCVRRRNRREYRCDCGEHWYGRTCTKPRNERRVLRKIRSVPATSSNDARSTNKLENTLSYVTVKRQPAVEVQEFLRKQTFSRWRERSEAMSAREVDMENMNGFLDYMKSAYTGIDSDILTQLKGTEWSDYSQVVFELYFSQGKSRLIGYKYVDTQGRESENQKGAPYRTIDVSVTPSPGYGILVFSKSTDGRTFDWAYATYTMDFTIAPKRFLSNKPAEDSLMLGIMAEENNQEDDVKLVIKDADLERVKNFLRYKGLTEMVNDGIISRVKYVW